MIALLTGILRFYRAAISPWIGPHCRFYPTWSAYSIEALHTHGVFRGLGLTAWRLLRCHPFHPGGVDPVPPTRFPNRKTTP